MVFVPSPRLRPMPPSAFRQRANTRGPLPLRDSATVRYLPFAGTNGYDDPFAVDPQSPFQRTLALESFVPIRDDRGKPFNPAMGLDGISGKHAIWNTLADMLYYFLEYTPEADRNLIVSSHAGQPVWILAASGFRFRSVTFVGTPNRHDVGAATGIRYIDMAQVIFDRQVDLIAWLGSWFDRECDPDRSFAYLGARMKRYGYDGIGHIDVLHDPVLMRMWRIEPWLNNIRQA